MAHDASFLAKCEHFLLHPRVRALSLAQRVDFLENKGLSPEEITAILQNVERQNGLSRMLGGSAVSAAAADASSKQAVTTIGAGSGASSLWSLLRNYGLATAATLLLAFGYVRLRQRMVLHLIVTQRQAAFQRRQKRQLNAVETLRFVGDQRKQFGQVVARVKNRVTRLELLKSTQATEEEAAVAVEQKKEAQELCALQEQVRTLKTAVMQSYQAKVEKQVQEEITARSRVGAQQSLAATTRGEDENGSDSMALEQVLTETPVQYLAAA